jgi:hypothetical protein
VRVIYALNRLLQFLGEFITLPANAVALRL